MLNATRYLCLLLYLPLVVRCKKFPWIFNGTSPGLENIILGRCAQFKEFSQLNRLKDFSISVDCATVWKEFKNSFANKDICKVTVNDYDRFFALLNHTNAKKTYNLLFWSGTRTIAHDFSRVNDDYVSLEETLPGYLANQLRWCGCSNCSTGIDYNFCNETCPNNAYWNRASANFAGKATGTAYVLINGTARGSFPAYYRESFFGREELPNLGKLKRINKLVVLVALDMGVKPNEKCGQGTLVDLVADAKRYGIPEVECNDDSVIVSSILCAKYPHAEQCKKKSKKCSTSLAIVFICISGVFLLTIVGLTIALFRQRRVDATLQPLETESMPDSRSALTYNA